MKKLLWKGYFRLRHRVYFEYTRAYTERQAWLTFCRRVAKKEGVPLKWITNEFGGSGDNYEIIQNGSEDT